MLPKAKISFKLLLVIYLQIVSIFTAPLQMKLKHPVIIEAEPQVMMHTLQQPIPIETLQSLKTVKTAAKINQDLKLKTVQPFINGMYQLIKEQNSPIILSEMVPLNAESQLPQLSYMPQIILPPMYPILPQILHQSQIMQSPHDIPGLPMEYQQMPNEEFQQISLQEQMMALQQLQGLHHFNRIQSPVPMTMPQPVLVLLPDEKTEYTDHNDLFKNGEDDSETNELKHNEHVNEDIDSVIIENPNDVKGSRKAILYIPNAKLSIGGLISTIPWLPIEINVPDTVTWAWNGISSGIAGIISIIGSRLPFRPKPQVNVEEPAVKILLKQLQSNNYEPVIPVYGMPLDRVIPIQF